MMKEENSIETVRNSDELSSILSETILSSRTATCNQAHNEQSRKNTGKESCVRDLDPEKFYVKLMQLMITRPTILDESARKSIGDLFERSNLRSQNLISHAVLEGLSASKSQTSTWLAYERLLVHLIKAQLYEPKTLTSEVLTIVKSDMKKETATKFSSVLSECARHCREAITGDEEEEEKWCEIMDWLSWFMVGDDCDD